MSIMDERAFTETLLEWYRRSARDLPWRRTRDPYAVWVSETMLQQTRVETVIPYYERFMSDFPTVSALAQADEQRVLRRWEGLGYYSRARHLQAAAREVEARYGARVPDSEAALLDLPGVGPYTAGAVLSIAYGQPRPAVDGNVLRVASRLFAIMEDVRTPRIRKQVEHRIAALIPAADAGGFNQALMELGATCCTPRQPQCETCVVQAFCEARALGLERTLPVRRQSAVKREELRTALLLESDSGICVCQRPAAGLLARMWELPNIVACSRTGDGDAGEDAPQPAAGEMWRGEPGVVLERVFGAERDCVSGLSYVGAFTHEFSHLRWQVALWRGRTGAGCLPPYAFVPGDECQGLGFARVFARMLESVGLRKRGGDRDG